METVVVGVDNSDASTPSENEHRHRERQREIDAANEQILEPMSKIAEKGKVPHEEVVHHGKPSDTLLDIAKDHEAIHIVVGRTGDSGLREAIFGSVASRLVQHAKVPVTVVP